MFPKVIIFHQFLRYSYIFPSAHNNKTYVTQKRALHLSFPFSLDFFKKRRYYDSNYKIEFINLVLLLSTDTIEL